MQSETDIRCKFYYELRVKKGRRIMSRWNSAPNSWQYNNGNRTSPDNSFCGGTKKEILNIVIG